jgi:hypothetical protein
MNAAESNDADIDLRDAIERVAVEWPATENGGSYKSCIAVVGR